MERRTRGPPCSPAEASDSLRSFSLSSELTLDHCWRLVVASVGGGGGEGEPSSRQRDPHHLTQVQGDLSRKSGPLSEIKSNHLVYPGINYPPTLQMAKERERQCCFPVVRAPAAGRDEKERKKEGFQFKSLPFQVSGSVGLFRLALLDLGLRTTREGHTHNRQQREVRGGRLPEGLEPFQIG